MHRLAAFLFLALMMGCGGVSKKKSETIELAPLPDRAYAHYLRGQLSFFRGDYEEARTELAAAARVSPGQAPISRALAEAHYQAGDRKSAEREVTRATQLWPNDAEVWKLRGQFFARARDFVDASSAYAKALRCGAQDEETRLAYAEALAESGKKEEAAAILRKLVSSEESSAEGHYQLARLLYQDAKYSVAARHADAASTQNSYDLRAWALLAASHHALSDHDQAADALRQPFDRSRGALDVGGQLFVELLDLGATELAIASVKILDRDDLSIDTRIGMGHWLLRAGDFEGALALADKLEGPKPRASALAELRARALRALGREAQAMAHLSAIAEDDASYALMRSMLAGIHADAGRASEARRVLEACMETQPDHPDLIMTLAAVEESTGEVDKARAILKEAVAKHPGAVRPLFALAEIEARAGRPAEAIATIAPMLVANPKSYASLNYIGYTLIDNPKAQGRARDMLLRALELAPDSAFVLDSYGWLLLKRGDLEHAAPLLERAVRLTPTEPELLAHLAELRWRQGNRDGAQDLLDRAQSLAFSTHLKVALEAVRKRISQQMPSAQP